MQRSALCRYRREFSNDVRWKMSSMSFPTMYAAFTCPNFHFSVSFHVPFLSISFQIDPNSNEYVLAKFGFDTAENELDFRLICFLNFVPSRYLILPYVSHPLGGAEESASLYVSLGQKGNAKKFGRTTIFWGRCWLTNATTSCVLFFRSFFNGE